MSSDLLDVARAALPAQLDELHQAIESLAEPLTHEQFWRKPIEPGNSIGHLVLHLTGNLRHFVGAQIGGSGYVRDREREFTEADVPSKAAALAGLRDAVTEFRQVVESLSAAKMTAMHPDAARMGTTLNALVRVLAHFALHRGQMSYIVRMVS